MANEYSIQFLHASALSCRAEPATPQAIVLKVKSLRSLRPLRAKRKHPGGGYYCLTQRAQRTQRFNSPTAHAGAGVVASFTTTRERRGRMTNEYSIQFLQASLCALLSCGASDLSSNSVKSKSLRSLRALRAKRKHPGGGYYCLTQRAQRTQRFNSLTAHAGAGGVASFTTTGERRGKMANGYTI